MVPPPNMMGPYGQVAHPQQMPGQNYAQQSPSGPYGAQSGNYGPPGGASYQSPYGSQPSPYSQVIQNQGPPPGYYNQQGPSFQNQGRPHAQ